MMEGLAHWPSVVRTYNHARRRLSCVRNPEWRSLSCGSRNPQCTGSPGCGEGACRGGPYNCTGILYGNSIFAPVIGSPSIQSLPMLRGVQQCLELIEAQEEARGGVRYERIVFSRLEFWWLRPHPLLRLLDPSVVWLPSGEDYYGGVNDRHAVLNRSAAEVP